MPEMPDISNIGSKLNYGFSVERIVSNVAKQLQEIVMKLQPLNVFSVGRSESENLALLKKIFGPRYFDRDHFCQYTDSVVRYQKEHHPLCVYQTTWQGDSFRDLSASLKLMEECARSQQTALNLLICCLGDRSGRVESWEYPAMLQLLVQDEMPVLVVLPENTAPEALEYTQKFLEENGLAERSAVTAKAEELCSKIMQLLPDAQTQSVKDKIFPAPSVRDTFVHLERLDYAVKGERIQKLIEKASGATAAEAAVSPIADWIVMAPTEALMMAGINSYFEVTVSSRIIKTLLPAVLGTGAATIAGKTISDFLGQIPQLRALGAVTDAATASAVTKLIGNTYYQLLLAIEKHEISEDELGTKSGIYKLKQFIKNARKTKENPEPAI